MPPYAPSSHPASLSNFTGVIFGAARSGRRTSATAPATRFCWARSTSAPTVITVANGRRKREHVRGHGQRHQPYHVQSADAGSSGIHSRAHPAISAAYTSAAQISCSAMVRCTPFLTRSAPRSSENLRQSRRRPGDQCVGRGILNRLARFQEELLTVVCPRIACRERTPPGIAQCYLVSVAEGLNATLSF